MEKGITVYCASSDAIPQVYFEAARELGAAIAAADVPVINGGGRIGLMGAVNDAVLAAGGQAIGVIPQFMVDKGLNHPALTRTIVTRTMHERKQTMADLAIGCIALPGGVGTFEELTEMMTWRKLGLFAGPVVILNTNGYYDDLLDLLGRSVAEGFTYGTPCWSVANTPADAVDMIISR